MENIGSVVFLRRYVAELSSPGCNSIELGSGNRRFARISPAYRTCCEALDGSSGDSWCNFESGTLTDRESPDTPNEFLILDIVFRPI